MRRLVPVLLAALATATPAFALTPQECSTKYQAAKRDGSLGARKWNEFRKAECGATALEPATVPNPLGGGGASSAPATKPDVARQVPAPANKGGAAVYPRAIGTAHASESPGKARLKTCLDQYNANKATGGNGDMKWIEKGGGYYSACNARLKG